MITIQTGQQSKDGGKSSKKRGGVRGLLLKASGPVALLAALVVICIVLWMRSLPVPAQPLQAYFIDEKTGDPVVRNADELPPLANAAGQLTVVRAYYFNCTGLDQKWVGYYGKIDPPALEQVRKDMAARKGRVSVMSMGLPASYRQNLLVRLPQKDSPWVHAASAEGEALLASIKCPHGKGHAIFPAAPDEP